MPVANRQIVSSTSCSTANEFFIRFRLSENPSLIVGLIEAGVFHENDPLVDIPGKIKTHRIIIDILV